MSTHNIGFYEDLTKIIIKYHQIRTLFLLLKYSVIMITRVISVNITYLHIIEFKQWSVIACC